eukprot:GEMP01059915.1.p1 GENE.GEMP01059915.1~~GEMP01059915.1.p1  ORF type:complete len:457 (+),score=110.44 GEMP01059915.1:1-1371(+)
MMPMGKGDGGMPMMLPGGMPFPPPAGFPLGKGAQMPFGFPHKNSLGPRMGSFAPQKKQSPAALQQQMLLNAAFAAGFRPPPGIIPGKGGFVAPPGGALPPGGAPPPAGAPPPDGKGGPPYADGATEKGGMKGGPPSTAVPAAAVKSGLKGVTDGLLGFGEKTMDGLPPPPPPLLPPGMVPPGILPPGVLPPGMIPMEQDDRALCPFYMKIGACRHGDQCSRQHNKPIGATGLLLGHMYPNTQESMMIAQEEAWTDEMYDKAQAHIEQFYTEVFLELANYGEIEDMVVVDNASDHMIGNVYVKYYNSQDCERALQKLSGRFYGGKLIQAEASPVVDFREARCRAFHESRCNRGGYCNFMHIKHIPKAIKRRLVRMMYEEHPEYGGALPEMVKEKRSRSRRRDRSVSSEEEGEEEAASPAPRIDGVIINPYRRDTSEERRALVSQWNRDLEAGTLVCA